MRFVLLFAIAIAPCFPIEIATGKMLGPGYEVRAFYTRAKSADPWIKTYTGAQFRPEAAGKLMNLRLAQAWFHDEWLTEEPFDPVKHTERYIQALDVYKAHGILAVSASLQGGNMAYERTDNIKRMRSNSLGPAKGALVSAFEKNGSLKKPWMDRALRFARELDKRGMILNLMYLYAHQDELFEGPQAIDRAVANATDWVIDNNLRNVIIEVANEYDIKAWDQDRYVPNNIDKLIGIARARFDAKKAKFRVPVTASSTSAKVYPVQSDLTIVHGNGRTPDQKRKQTTGLYDNPNAPGPIYMNEDDNGRETTPEILAKELASCTAVFESGGSWGYMPWIQLQIYPFRHVMPAESSKMTPDMPVAQRDPAYFKAVLEHIRKLLYRN